ncbi:ATP-binding protein [Agromyces silvae]|uniref:ATP-binding protein n=1 Tax=Agromyces silvae TaxID=3388266 RepID=UPI00280ABD50|nr:ATP-binding protein [Agromyces protaetiae]
MSTEGELIRVTGSADETFLDDVHRALAELWQLAPANDEDRMLFELAVVEVATNIVQHGASDLGPVEARLDLEATDDDLIAVFRDSANPPILDLSRVAMPDTDAEAGRGLALALAALDELSHLTDEGNTWRLRRRRREPSAD